MDTQHDFNFSNAGNKFKGVIAQLLLDAYYGEEEYIPSPESIQNPSKSYFEKQLKYSFEKAG